MTEQDIKRYLEKSKDKHIEAENLIENEHGFMSWTTWEDYLVVIQVYGDGAYWNKELDKIAKELGYEKIMMATKRNYKLGVDKISVYEYKDGVYYKIHSLGIPNNLLELNLRDATGKVVKTSFWSNVNGKTSVKVKTSGGKIKAVDLTAREGITSSQVGITSSKGETRNTGTQTNLDKNCK